MSSRKIHYAWFILASCCLMMMGSVGIVANCAGLFLTPVGNDLGISRGAISAYFTISTLVMAFSAPFAGKILSRWNIRKVLSVAIVGHATAFGMMSQYYTVTGWYISAVFIGFFAAFIVFLPVPILINNWFKDKIGFAMGLALSFSGLGGAVFNKVGGQLIASYGWRNAYMMMAGMAALIALPCILFVVRTKPSDMGLLPYGAEKVQTESSATIELKGITFRQAVKTPFFYLCLVFAGSLALIASFQLQLPSFAATMGFPITRAATVASFLMIGTLMGKIIIGFINDKLGVGAAMAFGLMATLAGITLLLGGGCLDIFVFLGGFVFGIGFALLSVGPALLVRNVFGPKEYGIIFGYVSGGLNLCSAFASALYGFMFDKTQSYTSGLLMAVGFTLLGGISVSIVLAGKKSLQQK